MLGRISIFAVIVALFPLSEAHSQSMEATSQALALITKTADSICGIVKTAGNYQDVKVKADIKAQLNGLIKQLADLGVSGALDYDADQYEGFVRSDLATAFQQNAQCKYNVFDKLQAKIIK